MNIKEPKIGTHHLGLKTTFEHRTTSYGENQVFLCIHMKDGSREYYVVESVSTDMKSMTQEYTLITGETLMVDKEDSGFGTIYRVHIPQQEAPMDFFEGETLEYKRPERKISDLMDDVQKWRKEKELELARGEDWGTFS